jgi:hypothetical protein
MGMRPETADWDRVPVAAWVKARPTHALGNYALTPVATAIAGPLATAFGTTAVLTTGGVLVVILPALVLLVPEVRHMRRK